MIRSLILIILLFSIQTEAKTWKIPVLYWSMKIEGQVLMRKGLEEEAHSFNANNSDKVELIPYVAGEGRDGIIRQTEQFKQALKKSPDGIIIQPTDNAALSAGLQLANQEQVPVVAYDQYIVDGKMSAFVTSDNYQGGIDNGNYIDSLFPKGKDIQIVVFEYPQVSSTTERIDGFFDALRARGRKFKVVQRYQAVDPSSGKSAAAQFLKDFPVKGSVDVIFTVNDGGGLSIVKELNAKKRTEIKHATFDGDPQSIENIREGRLTVIDSAQFCAELGRRAFREMIQTLKGRKGAVKSRVPTFAITEKTIKDFPGWLGVPPIPAKKLKWLSLPKTAEGGVFKIGATPLCPYLCEKRPGVWTGYLYEILNEIASSQGMELRLENLPNSRLLQAVATHKVDYVIAPQYLVRYSPDVKIVGRELGVSFTGALLQKDSDMSLIDVVSIRKSKVVFSDFGYDRDKGTALGIILEKGNRLNGSDVAERMIKMMKDQRVDLALGDYNVIRYSMIEEKENHLKLVPTSLTGFSFFVLAGLPSNTRVDGLDGKLNEWFEIARANGHLDAILKKYNLTDWQMLDRY